MLRKNYLFSTKKFGGTDIPVCFFDTFWALSIALMLLPPIASIGGCGSSSGSFVETYTVKRGEFVNSVTETGELEPVNSKIISAPWMPWRLGELKITQLVEDGKEVEEGYLLIEFDRSEIEKGIVDAQTELEIAQSELRKAQVSHQSEMEESLANLEIAKLNHRISQLKLEQASFEAEIKLREIELNLEKAAIALEKAQQEIENKKIVNRQKISKLELKVQQVQTRLDEARETVDKLTVTAPAPGIAIIRKSRRTGAKFQVDDQTWRAESIIGLPDLSSMKAEVQINEVDIAKIGTGQSAIIKLDAYPDTSFHGHVSDVAVMGRNKDRESKVKVFDATILLDENNKQLMPGMTVSCEIIVEQIPDTLFIPLEALFREDGKNIVYLKKGGDFKPRHVAIGPENDNYVIITEGIKESDQVALTDPRVDRMEGASDIKKEAAQ